MQGGGIPLWTVFPLTVAIIVASVEIGYRVGRRERKRPRHDSRSLASALTTPAGALVGLILAFTFGWAATRYDVHRTVRIDEALALGHVFHLADVLPPGDRDTVRVLIRDYIKTSLEMRDLATTELGFRRRAVLNQKLWTIASTTGRSNPTSLMAASFVASVSEVMGTNLKRSVLGQVGRIPATIVAAVYLILATTMGMLGYQMGLAGDWRSPSIIPLSISIALVFFLIGDLDRPLEGAMRVGNTALEQLQGMLGTSP